MLFLLAINHFYFDGFFYYSNEYQPAIYSSYMHVGSGVAIAWDPDIKVGALVAVHSYSFVLMSSLNDMLSLTIQYSIEGTLSTQELT